MSNLQPPASSLEETTVRSEKLLSGKLLHVYRDEARLPDGRVAVREWIKHPGAAAVVPLFDDGTVLLVRQFRYPPRRVFLEIPAGKLDAPGEDPQAAAQRELEEETGYRAGRLDALGTLFPCIGYSDEAIHFFLGRDLVEGRRALAEGEHMESVRMPFAEAVAMAERGEMGDMKTAAALLMARALLGGAAPGALSEKTA